MVTLSMPHLAKDKISRTPWFLVRRVLTIHNGKNFAVDWMTYPIFEIEGGTAEFTQNAGT